MLPQHINRELDQAYQRNKDRCLAYARQKIPRERVVGRV